jgi:hypothetical protein
LLGIQISPPDLLVVPPAAADFSSMITEAPLLRAVAAAAEAAAPRRLVSCDIDLEVTSVENLAVHLRPSVGRAGLVSESDETEASRPTSVSVGYYLRFHDLTERGKRRAEGSVVRIPRQTTNEELRSHRCTPLLYQEDDAMPSWPTHP